MNTALYYGLPTASIDYCSSCSDSEHVGLIAAITRRIYYDLQNFKSR